MEKKLYFITKIITYIIMGLGVILLFFVLFNGDVFAKVTEESVNSSILDYFTYLTFFAIALTAIIALIFPIINAVTHPKQALKGLLILLAFAVIGLISYLLTMGDSGLTAQDLAKLGTTESTVKIVGASLCFTYIMTAIAIIVAIASPFLNKIKKSKK